MLKWILLLLVTPAFAGDGIVGTWVIGDVEMHFTAAGTCQVLKQGQPVVTDCVYKLNGSELYMSAKLDDEYRNGVMEVDINANFILATEDGSTEIWRRLD